MNVSRRLLLGSAAAAAALPNRRARAQDKNTIRIGVLNDQSGPYRDTGGLTSVACTKQAVDEFKAQGFAVEVIMADHQNKPDIGSGIARQWYDRDGVDVILDVPTSSVALAVASVAKEKDKAYLNIGAATADLTGKACAPCIVHWAYDVYMLGKSTGGATVRSGGDSWYFITADYVFGHQLQTQTTRFVEAAGGKVLGSSAYPFPGTSDFSSLPFAGAGERREGAGLLQRRRGHGEQHQAGARVRHPDAACGDADVHHRRARARPRRRAGADADREFLLGPERPHPRVHRAGQAAHAEQLAEHDPRRLLRGHAALPEGRAADRRGRRRSRAAPPWWPR